MLHETLPRYIIGCGSGTRGLVHRAGWLGDHMRSFLTTAVCVGGACLALSASAQADFAISGYGEIGGGIGVAALSTSDTYCSGTTFPPLTCRSYGTSHVSSTPKDLVADLHVATMLNDVWQLQLDAEANRDFVGQMSWPSNSDHTTKYGVGVHLDMLTEHDRLGGFVSVGNSDWTRYQNRLASVGLEGEWFFGNTSLFSQYVFSHTISGDFSPSGLYSNFLDAGVRHFLTDNLMLETNVGAGLAESKADIRYSERSNHSAAALKWGAKTEFRFEDFPISLAIAYRGTYNNWRRDTWGVLPPPPCSHGASSYFAASYPYRRTENLFQVTLRYYLGQASLLTNDRTGAAMSDYNPWYGAEPQTEAIAGQGFYSLTTAPAAAYC